MKALLSMAYLLLLVMPTPAADPPPAPDVIIELGCRQAQGVPNRTGFNHTGGGNIDVQQPSPDVVVVTMTGVAVAGGCPGKDSVAALMFDLSQEFDIRIAKPEKTKAKLTMEARVIGLLRSHIHGGGTAAINCPATAMVFPAGVESSHSLLALNMPGRAVQCGQNLSVNDQVGPVGIDVPAGRFVLREQFGIQACHPKRLWPCKAASAEFAPDPALDPLWISAFEPFRGAQKKDFGFQVTLKVATD